MFLLLLATLAADPSPAASPLLARDVVPSSDGKVAYARALEGGIEAIDLATGKPLWVNKDVTEIAGATKRFALAWQTPENTPNAFRIIGLDAETGKAVFKSDLITLPEWATTGTAYGRSFRISAFGSGEKVVVVWQANSFYAGGAPPPPAIQAAARRQATGVVTIEPQTGKAALEDRKPKEEEFGLVNPSLSGLDFSVTEQLLEVRPGTPMKTKETLKATKEGKIIWERELAGRTRLPPQP